MNVLFLDIDGVLNSEFYYEHCRKQDSDIDDYKVMLIANLVKQFNLRIVLTSSWRESNIVETKKRLIEKEPSLASLVPYMIDQTRRREDRVRGYEIQDWINHNKQHINKYVIIDDDDFDILEVQKPNLIKVNNYFGVMTSDIIPRIFEILGDDVHIYKR